MLDHQRAFRFATLWQIDRDDGTTLYFTDHNAPVTYNSQTYLPMGSFDASARQAQESMDTQNLQVIGVINSDDITLDDLRAGLYREAMITERLVDWKYPWQGTFVETEYWITETKFGPLGWQADLTGLKRWLRHKVGHVFGSRCRHVLGDGGCKVNVAAITISSSVTVIDTQRFMFQTGLGDADDHFSMGLLTWTSGNNAGLGTFSEFDVRQYLNTNGQIRLETKTPYDIQVGDTFNIYPGCDKLKSTCRDKFINPSDPSDPNGNLDNFGGYDMPGNHKLTRTPTRKR